MIDAGLDFACYGGTLPRFEVFECFVLSLFRLVV